MCKYNLHCVYILYSVYTVIYIHRYIFTCVYICVCIGEGILNEKKAKRSGRKKSNGNEKISLGALLGAIALERYRL